MVKNKGFTFIELIILIAIASIIATVIIDIKQRESDGPTDNIDINTTEQIEINGVLNNCDELDCTPVNE